ncbi:hypothetical protein [Anianabacter salinae]|uniref:hypothetical protein n=1 Tax=Anianabacter salinae TaxID=2851023 RepID=UPI00225E6400|nr:hypothetical protein [Anianabacter salinae]
MITRLTGALVRAILMVLLVVMPSFALPGVTSDTMQIVALVAIFAAGLIIFEYGSVYPGLIEFRDAPPFNRIRFVSLLSTVFVLTLISRNSMDPTALGSFFQAFGYKMAGIFDFPYSPVRLVVLMLPENTSYALVQQLRIAAAIAYVISLLSLALFYYVIRMRRWPVHSGTFNVWVNLPTFDPTVGGDIVNRLTRDARFNIVLGFLMPFFVPAMTKAAGSLFGVIAMDNPQTMIWIVAAWAFLPASLFMRGLAMSRIAALIEAKRRMNAQATGAMLQPA